MGPSGAGKDSVLGYARTHLDRRDRIVFAHRYITRPAGAGGENHIALTRSEFDLRKAAGLFAFDWQAHETCYGIGIEVQHWRHAGLTVVVSGSRGNFAALDPEPGAIVPVVITAPPALLAQRLAERGRETEAQILSRLQRTPETANDPTTVVIDNSGPLDVAGRRFVETLRSLARADAAA